jgi:hypothetical protein
VSFSEASPLDSFLSGSGETGAIQIRSLPAASNGSH